MRVAGLYAAPAGATLFDTYAGRLDPNLVAANQAVIIGAP